MHRAKLTALILVVVGVGALSPEAVVALFAVITLSRAIQNKRGRTIENMLSGPEEFPDVADYGFKSWCVSVKEGVLKNDLYDDPAFPMPTSGGEGPPHSVLGMHSCMIFVQVPKPAKADAKLLKASLRAGTNVGVQNVYDVELKTSETNDLVLDITGNGGEGAADASENRIRVDHAGCKGARTYFVRKEGSVVEIGHFSPLDPNGTHVHGKLEDAGTFNGLSDGHFVFGESGMDIDAIIVCAGEGETLPPFNDIRGFLHRRAVKNTSGYGAITQGADRSGFAGANAACGDPDWNSWTPIGASSECLAAVRASCASDPDQRDCECWGTGDASSTQQCKGQRILFGEAVVNEEPGAQSSGRQQDVESTRAKTDDVVVDERSPSYYAPLPGVSFFAPF